MPSQVLQSESLPKALLRSETWSSRGRRAPSLVTLYGPGVVLVAAGICGAALFALILIAFKHTGQNVDRRTADAALIVVVTGLALAATGVVWLSRARRDRLRDIERLAIERLSPIKSSDVEEQVKHVGYLLGSATSLLTQLQHQVAAQIRVLEDTAARAQDRARQADALASQYEDRARASRTLAAINEEAAAAFTEAIDARFQATDRRNLTTQVVFFLLAFAAGILTAVWLG